MASNVGSYLIFRVGNEWYSISVDVVIEVLHMVALSEVPGSNILGMMTHREHTIEVIDLRQRFGIANPEYKLDTPIVVLKTPRGRIGVVVSETDDILQIPPESMTPYNNDLISGVFRLNGRMIFVVEPAKLQANLSEEHTAH
jgi:purine-binding chemotaxis protein CheW